MAEEIDRVSSFVSFAKRNIPENGYSRSLTHGRCWHFYGSRGKGQIVICFSVSRKNSTTVTIRLCERKLEGSISFFDMTLGVHQVFAIGRDLTGDGAEKFLGFLQTADTSGPAEVLKLVS